MSSAGELVTGPDEWVIYLGKRRPGLGAQLDELRAKLEGGDQGWLASDHFWLSSSGWKPTTDDRWMWSRFQMGWSATCTRYLVHGV